MSNDPLAQVIGLLQPSASLSKLVTASGCWAVRPPETRPFYAAILDGDCELSITGRVEVRAGRGDFLLIPAATNVTVSSLPPPPSGRFTEPAEVRPGVSHLGERAHPTRIC